MRLEQRSSDGESAAGRTGGSSPDASVHTQSHTVASAIPAVFIAVLIIISLLLARYLILRMRRSGRRLLTFLTDTARKPRLSDVILSKSSSQDTRWDTLSPVSAEYLSEMDYQHWQQFHRTSKVRAVCVAHAEKQSHRGREAYLLRGLRNFSSSGRREMSMSETVGLRVAIFIAMPGQQRGQSQSDRDMLSGSTEVCLGTLDVSC